MKALQNNTLTYPTTKQKGNAGHPMKSLQKKICLSHNGNSIALKTQKAKRNTILLGSRTSLSWEICTCVYLNMWGLSTAVACS